MSYEIYQDPLVGRYTSKEMQQLFSSQWKFTTWRKCRVALAESQKELWLDLITQDMVDELSAAVHTIDYDIAKAKEKEIRHDVMAHVFEFGTHCPTAKGIIHLWATSQFVNDNTELLQMKTWLQILKNKLVRVIANFAQIADQYKDVVTLWFTHYQSAQPTTVGKRMTLYIQDLLMDLEALEKLSIPARWAKGTTGTQASYLELFQGDFAKVKELDRLVAQKLWYDDVFAVTGQTYPRKFDSKIAEVLAWIAVSLTKFATDLRLLSNQKIVDEPFSINQTWSSAMAYKRNPMRSERLCALARKLTWLVANFYQTAGVQWLERTLDDSAIRRMDIPQVFLLTDALLILALNISNQEVDPVVWRPLTFYVKRIQYLLNQELPFMTTEAILMDLAHEGYDRQEMHELIKEHSVAAWLAVKEQGKENNLFERLWADSAFPLSFEQLQTYLYSPERYAGAAVMQTKDFLQEKVAPVLEAYKEILDADVVVDISV